MRAAFEHLDATMTSLSLRRFALPLGIVALTAAAVIGAGLIGRWFGHGYAADQGRLQRNDAHPAAGTVTVVFIDGDRVVEKVLNAKTKTWLPQTVIRPIPESGSATNGCASARRIGSGSGGLALRTQHLQAARSARATS